MYRNSDGEKTGRKSFASCIEPFLPLISAFILAIATKLIFFFRILMKFIVNNYISIIFVRILNIETHEKFSNKLKTTLRVF
jgi:hypothetical protein